MSSYVENTAMEPAAISSLEFDYNKSPLQFIAFCNTLHGVSAIKELFSRPGQSGVLK